MQSLEDDNTEGMAGFQQTSMPPLAATDGVQMLPYDLHRSGNKGAKAKQEVSEEVCLLLCEFALI